MLRELSTIIDRRKIHAPETSYTASLFAAGEDEILKKIGEEAMEVIIAAKGQGDARLVEEVADLLYHVLVLLSSRNLSIQHVEKELRKRHTRAASK